MTTIPFFLKSLSGRIFITSFQNTSERSDSVFILIPPIGEEMNKSRRMLALMANQLAESGFNALIPDFHGTGDSEGDFSEANLTMWHSDLDSLISWCGDEGYTKFNFLALRSGAVILLDYLSQRHTFEVDKVVLWHPMSTGDSWLTQFLRLRLAGGFSGNIEKETLKGLKTQLQVGEPLEVAGYELSAQFANAIREINIAEISPTSCEKLLWIDVVATEGRPILPASKKVIDHWEDSSFSIDSTVVVGPAFWSAVEIVDVDALIDVTQAFVRAEG